MEELERYVGVYDMATVGEVDVSLSGSTLMATFASGSTTLYHWAGRSFAFLLPSGLPNLPSFYGGIYLTATFFPGDDDGPAYMATHIGVGRKR